MTMFVGCAYKMEHIKHCQSNNLLVNQVMCVMLLSDPWSETRNPSSSSGPSLVGRSWPPDAGSEGGAGPQRGLLEAEPTVSAELHSQIPEEPPAVWETGLSPGSGRFPGGGDGYTAVFCLENSMGRGAWRLQSMLLQRVGHAWETFTFTVNVIMINNFSAWDRPSSHTNEEFYPFFKFSYFIWINVSPPYLSCVPLLYVALLIWGHDINTKCT